MRTPFARVWRLWLGLAVLLLGITNPTSARESQQRRMLKRRKPGPAAGPKDLALNECYEAGLAEHGHMGFSPEFFPLCTALAPGQVVLYWKPPDNTSTAVPSNITFGVVAKRKGSGGSSGGGWIALGFSEESQGMKGMDVALLRKRHYGIETGTAVNNDTTATNPSSSAFVLEDRFSRDYTVPTLDKVQNKILLQATESKASASSTSAGRVTSFVFSMPTSQCPDGHEEDISLVPGRRTFVMWAMGNEAPIGSGTSSSASSSSGSSSTSSSSGSGDSDATEDEASGINGSGGGQATQDLMYHGPTMRGSGALHLLTTPEAFKKESAPVMVPSSGKKRDKAGKLKTLRVTLPRVSIPAVRTHYFCMYAEVPQDRKYHVYQSRFLLNGTSESSPSTSTSESSLSSSLPNGQQPADDLSAPPLSRLVHHAILYASSHNNTRGHKVGEPFDCTRELPISQGLPYLIASHASMTSPSDELWEDVDAALPLGQGYGKYVILEVHYDNPAFVEGAVDSSGFELVLSPTLRTHDAGTFLVGSIPTTPETNTTSPLVIPPGRARHDYVDYCPSTCTRKSLVRQPPLAFPPANGTTSSTENATDVEAGKTPSSSSSSSSSAPAHILYARLHMHTLGKSGEIQVIHNQSKSDSSSSSGDGTEGEGLVRRRLVHRDYWDFNNQQGIAFAAPGVPFWPGDGILTRCTYNSLGQTRNVTWGEAASDEMCLGYIFYYPAPKTHAVACFDLNDAQQSMLDKWKELNHGDPLNVAACFPINEYAQAIASPQYNRVFVEGGMVLETPLGERGLKRTFNESAIWNPVCTNVSGGAGGGRGGG